MTVHQVGPNESALNGTPIGLGIEQIAKENDTIDVLFGQYRYRVTFEGLAPVESSSEKPAKIAKIFNNGNSQFKKDTAAPKGGEWTSKGDQLYIYTFGDIITRAKANVRKSCLITHKRQFSSQLNFK